MNDAPPSLNELISRHFDEALPPLEHQRLTEALNADFEARLDFVEAARLHAGLEALAPALPPIKKRFVGRWVLAGAAAALMIGGGALFLNQPRGAQVRITLQDMDAVPDGKPEKLKPSGMAKRVVKSPAAALEAGAEPVDVQKLLERYYVNVSPHGLTVPQALAQLEEAIKFENVWKRPELDRLSFSASNPVDSMFADPIVCIPQRTPMTVRNYIENCNLFRYVLQNPGSFIVIPPSVDAIPSAAEFPSEIRELKVPPDFLMLGGNKPPYPEGNAAAAVLARSFGILLADDESATFSSNPPTLTVLALLGKLDQLEQRLEAHGKNIFTKQVFVTTRYLKLPRLLLPVGFDEESGQVMSDKAFFQFLAAFKDDRRVVTVQAQSIIVRAGQRGKIEIVQEIGSRKPKKDSIGFSQDIMASLSGELIRIDGLIELGVLNGLAMPGGFDALGLMTNGAHGPQYFRTEYEVWLPDRSTGLFVADSPQSEGFVTLACLTTTMIDPAGQPVNPTDPELLETRLDSVRKTRERAISSGSAEDSSKKANLDIPNGKSVAGKPGFVTSPWAPDQGTVDVRQIPGGAKVKCPFTGKVFLVP